MKTESSNILSLIAATIFADKHIYASEIDSFLKCSVRLPVLRRLEPKLSEARLLSWYEMNKADIQGKLVNENFRDWFDEILSQLSSVPEKQSILDVMEGIAHADNELHVSERALIALAKRQWGLV